MLRINLREHSGRAVILGPFGAGREMGLLILAWDLSLSAKPNVCRYRWL
jgi:hypothetical protein